MLFDIESDEKIDDDRKILDLVVVELFQVERTLIFLGENSSMNLFSMFRKASSCHFGEDQKLLINLVICKLTNIDQENNKSVLQR